MITGDLKNQRLGGRATHPRLWAFLGPLALVGLGALATRMALATGITADEIVQRIYGDLILAYYRSGFTDQRALSFVNLYLYGGLFELPAQWLVSTTILPWPVYETRHVLTALVGLVGVVCTWLTARRIQGRRAALLSALALLLTPAWVGHSLFNSKDIPFAAAASGVLYASVRIALGPATLRIRDALFAALTLGAALGVRSGGMFLVAYPLGALCLRFALALRARAGQARPVSAFARSASLLVAVFPVAWLLMLSAWPWALQSPFSRPMEAAAVAADFDLTGKTRFEGSFVSFTHLPASYLPTWFAVTLPDFYWLGALCAGLALLSAVRAARVGQPADPRHVTATLVLLAFVAAPVLGVMIARPTLYDGHRHFLFLIPALAVLFGLALDHALRSAMLPVSLRAGLAVLAFALGSVTLYDMWTLHPYQYVYFNRASGGLARQASRFETDYWGASYREGFAWVVENYDRGGQRKVNVRSCAADKVLGYYRKQWHAERFAAAASSGDTELYLSTTKRDCHKKPGEVIHTVERQGVPLLYVIKQK